MNAKHNYITARILLFVLPGLFLFGSLSLTMVVGAARAEEAGTILDNSTINSTIVDTPTRTVTPTPANGCPAGIWNVLPSMNTDTGANSLSSIAVVSPDDIWAVGSYSDDLLGITQTLILHWDGADWEMADSPNIETGSNTLHDVAAINADDIWAVGDYVSDTSRLLQTLVLHWDGNDWTRYPSPNAPSNTTHNSLLGVTTLAANDVWAVGYTLRNNVYRSLSMHYNGSTWDIVTSPNPSAGNNSLAAVAAVSANSVYAVGGMQEMIALSWNGTSWNPISLPDPGLRFSALHDVTVAPGGDIWAVGYASDGVNPQTLTLRNWSRVTSPTERGYAKLYSISALAANDIWAVGYYNLGILQQTLAMRWDGARWATVRSPYQPWTTALAGVEAISGSEVWAVGKVRSPEQTLTLRYSSQSCFTPTPTLTPTRTPTLCPINFTDVQPTDWFYSSVQCLYCHGAISGYADRTFQPGNNTTRAQMCKIVVLAFALPVNTAGGPHYDDVPPSDPFYSYIETASNNGLVSGYLDRTFHPGDNVTRGQLSKIVVSAAVVAYRWTLQNPQTPSFTDVPTTDTFYRYVETAVCHQIIAGYTDRTFQPGSNATRAQIAKIVCQASANSPVCGR